MICKRCEGTCQCGNGCECNGEQCDCKNCDCKNMKEVKIEKTVDFDSDLSFTLH